MPKGVFPRRSLAITFWEKVNKDGPTQPHMDTPCWEWTGSHVAGPFPYGLCGGRGNIRRSHRVSWQMENGPIPEGMEICHRCDNPPCVRPDHLFPGTQKENIADSIDKGRFNTQRERYSQDYIGEGNPSAKITQADVIAIRELLMNKRPQRLVAKMFSISKTQVARIGNRKSWQSI